MKTYIPIDPVIMVLINVIIVVAVVYYLLAMTGLLNVPIPRLR